MTAGRYAAVVRAERRADQADAAIRSLLTEADSRGAFNVAVSVLQSEAAKVRRRRPADAARIDAQLAGSILRIARQLHGFQPTRPRGAPRVPRPADLLTSFDTALSDDEAPTP